MNINTKRQLFQYCVILHTTETKDGRVEYTGAEVVIAPTTMLATSEKEVLFKVTRQIPEEKATNPDNVEIMIQTF